MCTIVNILAVSFQGGSLAKMGQHGDRSYFEHDGVVVNNTLPNDIGIEIATTGVGKALVEWGKKNLADFFYRHDYAAKEITVSFSDKHGNQFAGRFSTDIGFDEIVNFIAFGKRDDLRFRSNKSERDHAKLISEVQDIKSVFTKAKNASEN